MKLFVLRIPGADMSLWSSDPACGTLQWLLQSATTVPLVPSRPPGRVPGGIALATGKDPITLGVLGDFVCRTEDGALVALTADLSTLPSIWRYFSDAGLRTALVGVPCESPQAAGVNVCVGRTGAEVSDLALGPEARLKAASVENFEAARSLIQHDECDVLYLNEVGIEGVQRAYWRYHDPTHPFHRSNSGLDGVIRDYYAHLDQQLAATLELFNEPIALALIVDHGVSASKGAFAINEWLLREGLLVLSQPISDAAAWSEISIDWSRTKAFAAGGSVAQIWLNLEGRSPTGIVPQAEYEATCDDIRARLVRGDALARGWHITAESTGAPKAGLFAPADLAVTIEDYAVPVVSSVGHSDVCLDGDPLEPADIAPSGDGVAILTCPGLGAHAIDVSIPFTQLATTLIDMVELPASSLFPGTSAINSLREVGEASAMSDEEVLRERLRGLGYIE